MTQDKHTITLNTSTGPRYPTDSTMEFLLTSEGGDAIDRAIIACQRALAGLQELDQSIAKVRKAREERERADNHIRDFSDRELLAYSVKQDWVTIQLEDSVSATSKDLLALHEASLVVLEGGDPSDE